MLDTFVQFMDGASNADAILPRVARDSLQAAIDLLLITALDPAVAVANCADLVEIGHNAADYAIAHTNPRPNWIDQVETNDQFVDRLALEIESWLRQTSRKDNGDQSKHWETFGRWSNAWEGVREAAGRLHDAAIGATRSGFRKVARNPCTQLLPNFSATFLST
jgi:hypothetical protein